MSKKIEVKNSDVLQAIIRGRWHPMLEEIATWHAETHGVCFTEGWRKALRPGDIHDTNPLRAYDARYWFYEPDIAYFIEGEINRLWEYDFDRPHMNCAWIHESFNEDGTSRGVHFHIQVHNNTRRRTV